MNEYEFIFYLFIKKINMISDFNNLNKFILIYSIL